MSFGLQLSLAMLTAEAIAQNTLKNTVDQHVLTRSRQELTLTRAFLRPLIFKAPHCLAALRTLRPLKTLRPHIFMAPHFMKQF